MTKFKIGDHVRAPMKNAAEIIGIGLVIDGDQIYCLKYSEGKKELSTLEYESNLLHVREKP